MNKPKQPPAYFLILLIFTFLNYLLNYKIIPKPFNYLGFILIFFGVFINLWTDKLFKNAKTNVKFHTLPNKMICRGPFKFSRNPMYLGMLCILLGVAVFIGNLLSFIFPIIFIFVIELKFIPIEEKNMKKAFGKEYVKYKNKVRGWI